MQSIELKTVAQTAAELTVSPLTVRAWIQRGKIGATRIGRCVRVPMHEIRRLIDDGFTAATREGGR